MQLTKLLRSMICSAAILSAAPGFAEIVGTTLIDSIDGAALFATSAPGRDNELFVVEQAGFVHRLDLTTGRFDDQPFLDLRNFVNSGGEQGLLGLAFDPNFENNGYFYVNYTRGSGAGSTQIDRFQAANPQSSATVSLGTRSPVLDFPQARANHNGGWLGFSPIDGNLYIPTGDSGSANDPDNAAQNLASPLGKVLRIDVTGDDFPLDASANYRVPDDNPFASDGDDDTLAEIWSYGLRNPYRASFDRDTGDLWIGDVGQNAREEINFQPATSTGGENYGWRLREGDIATPTGGVGGARPTGNVDPVYDYLSNGLGLFGGNSVVGGFVYRGPDPEVEGRYFFGDSFPTQLWTFDPANPDGTVQNINSTIDPSGAINTPVGFGEDAVGNLYVLTLDGGVFRIDTDALRPGDFNADGQLTAADLPAWIAAFDETNAIADANGDNTVNAADYVAIRDRLDSTQPAAAFSAIATTSATLATAVPEPHSVVLLLTATMLFASRKTGRVSNS